jgi:carbonic anhydrase/acetyltransferase-like protein (isoleucine patch superfamily)
LELVFRNSQHYLHSLIDEDQCPASSLKLLGQPLIVRNISTASSLLDIDTVMLPDTASSTINLLQEKFPSINIEKFNDNALIQDPSNSGVVICGNESIEIPINSLLRSSFSTISNENKNNTLLIDSIVYPWDFLNAIKRILSEEVKHTKISSNASVAKTSIIEGPCIIEDDVVIDDFSKIKGPTYISSGSFIGMSSLIRNCMIGNDSQIGFNCEIAKSYFAGYDKIAHQNVILDSILGENVWFGGYSGTANVLLTRKNIRYEIGDGRSIDTGTNHFGAVVGNNCAIGASVIILPGKQIPSHSIIQAGTIFGKKT